jgi:hypothetical protein
LDIQAADSGHSLLVPQLQGKKTEESIMSFLLPRRSATIIAITGLMIQGLNFKTYVADFDEVNRIRQPARGRNGMACPGYMRMTKSRL